MIQCLAVRPETRAREFVAVARLTTYGGKPKRKQVPAVPQGMRGRVSIVPKSQLPDLKPDDLFLCRLKSPFRGMEDRNQCLSNSLGDMGIGVKCHSNLVIAGSFRKSS